MTYKSNWSVKRWFHCCYHDNRSQASFTEERTRFYGMVDQKEEEYQCLKQLQANEKTEYEKRLRDSDQVYRVVVVCHMIVTWQAKNEAELNVAMTVEELTKVREKSIELETKLSGEVWHHQTSCDITIHHLSSCGIISSVIAWHHITTSNIMWHYRIICHHLTSHYIIRYLIWSICYHMLVKKRKNWKRIWYLH